MAETAVLGVGRNEIPPYYTELSKSTVQVLLTSAEVPLMATHEIFCKDEAGTLKKCIFTAPVGSVIAYPVDSVPDHCLECNGAVISRAAYSELFAVLGTVYGEGDGSTTFAVPDFRDKFLRGSGGVNGAAIGTAQGDAIRNIVGYFSIRNVLGGDMVNTIAPFSASSGEANAGVSVSGSRYVQRIEFNASTVVPTADENRPVNYAIKYCIIYE